jgi:hypothetical protein
VYIRVVRFTDVNPAQANALLDRIQAADGPPPGVPDHRFTILHDEQQATAVVLQYFDTKEEMSEAAQALSAMDAADTPGTRASVDTCEVKLDRHAR